MSFAIGGMSGCPLICEGSVCGVLVRNWFDRFKIIEPEEGSTEEKVIWGPIRRAQAQIEIPSVAFCTTTSAILDRFGNQFAR